MTDPLYPIGPYPHNPNPPPKPRNRHIEQIAGTPAAMRRAISGLTKDHLDTPYRDGGWTVRQVIHHVPDSHLNAYIRFKLALTEDAPTIKPYDEGAWATLADVPRAPIETSLVLLDALHARWVTLLELLGPAEFERRLVHPETGPMPLDRLLQMY